jgi:hypothetical protein
VIATAQALGQVDREIVLYHVDATDLFETQNEALREEVEHRQAIVYLPLDLISGRVNEHHALWNWLVAHGSTIQELDAFLSNPLELSVIGLNLYPTFTRKRLQRDPNGRFRIRMPYGDANLVRQLAKLYHDRYGSTLMISETASTGSVGRRLAWLEDSIVSVAELRRAGIPLAGYTWWPLFALVAWAYRQGSRPASDYFAQMGLFDLDADRERIVTPLVAAYRQLATGGIQAVDRLSTTILKRA